MKNFIKIASATSLIAVLVSDVMIMVRGAGLQKELDFGAGSYYYADIPDFDKYLRWDSFVSSLPYWVYVCIFVLWGILMFLLWIKVDSKKH